MSLSVEASSQSCMIPPAKGAKQHGIICEGAIDLDSSGKETLRKSCQHFTAINRGVIYCQANKLPVGSLIGHRIPFDELFPDTKYSVIVTSFEKNYTNLELAIKNTQLAYPQTPIMVYGATTRRIDHTIHSLSLLLKYPEKVFLATGKNLAFGVSFKGKYSSSWRTINVEGFKTIAFLPLNGSAGSLHLKAGGPSYEVLSQDLSSFKARHLSSDHPFIQLRSQGEFVVFLHREKLSRYPFVINEIKEGAIDASSKSFLDNGLFRTIDTLFTLAKMPKIKLFSETEEIHVISPSSDPKPMINLVGRVVSLIPFGGAVSGIQTTGLKWELGQNNSCDTLDNNNSGLSNVVISNSLTIKLHPPKDKKCGLLLLVVSTDLVNLKSNASAKSEEYKTEASKISTALTCLSIARSTSRAIEYSNTNSAILDTEIN